MLKAQQAGPLLLQQPLELSRPKRSLLLPNKARFYGLLLSPLQVATNGSLLTMGQLM